MPPVRVRYLGLMPMTKAGYLTTAAVVTLFAVGLFVIALLKGYLPPFRWPWDPLTAPAAGGFPGWVYNHFYELILVGLLGEVLDVVLMLRAFARKEAEQRTTTT